jgi:putative hydrolase of the HAD superfamily
VSDAGVRAVVFDLGEVLASPGTLLADLAARAALEEGHLSAAYWAHREEHDLGGTADAYWRSVLAAAGGADDEALRAWLADTDARVWSTIRADARETLAGLHAAGVRVAILSNAPHPMAQASRASDWAGWVDDWFFSAELGMAKPDDAVYATVTRHLGVAPGEILFFDDRQVNVDAARRAGWQAHLWTSGEAMQRTLRAAGLLPA